MNMKQTSEIGISYQTIKVTRSRIYRGLLAIPVSLIDKFPSQKIEILVYLDDEKEPQKKLFVPYKTKSRESRIFGLSSWFKKNNFQDGDEIIIEFIDPERNIISLKKEKKYINEIKTLQDELIYLTRKEDEDILKEETNISSQIENKIDVLIKRTNRSRMEILISQYFRLRELTREKRRKIRSNIIQKKEAVPSLHKKILEEVYQGRCQLSGFTFTTKDGRNYFEVHHIFPDIGNDFKNLLVVSPNIHAQFTYSIYRNIFDKEGWLRRVIFNNIEYNVKQLLDKISKEDYLKETHY